MWGGEKKEKEKEVKTFEVVGHLQRHWGRGGGGGFLLMAVVEQEPS